MKPTLFKLEHIFERFEHVPDMNVLGASDAESYRVGDLMNLADHPLDLEDISLGYDQVSGNQSLRQAIAASYSSDCSFENILVTNGASEGILLAMHVLLSPGDQALICEPAYQGLSEMAKSAGATVTNYHYSESNGFQPDLELIKKELKTRKYKVLLLNSPHNPTGQVINETALRTLLALAGEVDTQVIVDEVFHGIWINHEPVPTAVNLDLKAITIGALSKVFGLPGLRIGWLAGPRCFIEKCKELRYYTSLTPPSIVQQVGEIAVRQKQQILKRSQGNVLQNYDHVITWLESHRQFFDYVEPRGGTVMLIKLKLEISTKEFVEDLATKHRVFLVPCTWAFGMEAGYLRLGLGGNPSAFRDGLTTVAEYLLSNNFK